MRNVPKQSGLTFISFVMVCTVVGMFAMVGIKLGPSYVEYYSVVQAMNQISAIPKIGSASKAEIYKTLWARLDLSYVQSVKRQHVKITRSGVKKLIIKYDVRKPLIFNVDVIMKFKKSVDLLP